MSVLNLTDNSVNKDFVELVSKKSGEDFSKCYQCGKCSAGCPAANWMDFRPNRIIRMLQLGMKDEVLNSRAIWVCATCSTCTSRCPRNVDLARIMDTLRVISYERGITQKVKNEVIFHDCFNKSIKRWGRIYELGFILAQKFATTDFFNDAELGLPMLVKGKLKLLPPRMKGSNEIQRIADAIERLEGENK